MENKLVSVIITTYGRTEEILLEAINSVRKQTYGNIEIIVVDDNGKGSDRQKRNEIYFGNEKDIIYIVNNTNYGAQVSRNIGILESNGTYIACLDDDDLWDPQKIDKQVQELENNELDLVFCNGYRFYNNDLNQKKIYQFNFPINEEIDFQTELRGDCIGSTSIPLFRRKALAATGLFDIEMPARQDYDMWLRFCKHCRVKGINEPLFFYRYHEGERITKSIEKEIKSYRILWEKYKNEYKKDRISKAGILFLMAKTYLKGKRYVMGILYLFRGFSCSPTYIIKVLYAHRKGIPTF